MYEVATQQSGEMVSRNTQTEMMISRQAQEVQGAMVIAKRFPRDEVESFNRIMQSCKRKSLAESAMYEYPRGGTKVSGPSIRLAEAMAQNWGNIDFGITELEQKNGESQVMAYAWDLETNTRQVKIFSVPHVRGTKKDNDWKVRQNIEVCCFKGANEKALDLLTKGVTSLGFIIKGDEVNEENIATLLEGICPASVELNFNTCNCKAEKLIGILADYFKGKGVDAKKCYGSVNYDAFKKPLVKGKENSEWVEGAAAVLKAGQALPNYRVLAVNAFLFNNAGAYISQELGYALAWGNELMAKLTEAGFTADEVAKKIKFNFGISSNYFMEIAKFRAARWLWAEIVAAYKPACECACKMVAHAQTSEWNMTVYDAHVNLLRSQTEAMSAALAGVDSITVRPFDKIYQTPDDFSERIARNQQLLLKEECHLDKVVDPSAGSYYVEVLTNSLADVAWKLFLEVEEKGGFSVAVNAGEIQNAVNASNVARKKAVATRREILLGF